MRYPAEETAEKHRRILEEAARLFRAHGFAGVSVSQIMKATGLTHGPFYNHFASKEALMSEALGALSARTLDELDRVAAEKGIGAYLDQYLSRAHADNPGQGCLMAALASDAGKEAGARAAFTAHVKATLERVMRFLPGKRREDARAAAIRTLSAMVGALVLARAVDEPALSDEILETVRRELPR